MPAAEEVLAALRSEQQLFAGDAHARHLRHLREAACDAMGFFSRFDPRLVGTVLDGSAGQHSAVCLHLFADESEAVIHFLREQGIAHAHTRSEERRDGKEWVSTCGYRWSPNH